MRMLCNEKPVRFDGRMQAVIRVNPENEHIFFLSFERRQNQGIIPCQLDLGAQISASRPFRSTLEAISVVEIIAASHGLDLDDIIQEPGCVTVPLRHPEDRRRIQFLLEEPFRSGLRIPAGFVYHNLKADQLWKALVAPTQPPDYRTYERHGKDYWQLVKELARVGLRLNMTPDELPFGDYPWNKL